MPPKKGECRRVVPTRPLLWLDALAWMILCLYIMNYDMLSIKYGCTVQLTMLEQGGPSIFSTWCAVYCGSDDYGDWIMSTGARVLLYVPHLTTALAQSSMLVSNACV
jgi:hypothetical protein